MKRVVDKPYAAYPLNSTVISGICVKCPKCNQSGLVTADKTDVYFSCINCGYSKMRHRTTFRCQVENQCEQCGFYAKGATCGWPAKWRTNVSNVGDIIEYLFLTRINRIFLY